MLRFARWKVVSIVAMTLAALLIIVPSFLSKDTYTAIRTHLPKWIPFEQVVLGLDLQGGAHMLLEVDSADVIKTQVANLRDDVRRILREENIRITGGIGIQGRTVQVRIPDAGDRAKLLPKLRAIASGGGASALGVTSAAPYEVTEQPDGLVQITVTDAGLNDRIRRAVDQTIEVLRRRVAALGTTEPNIQRQ